MVGTTYKYVFPNFNIRKEMAKHNIKSILILFVLSLSSVFSVGQDIPIKLQWTKNIVINSNEKTYSVLHFEGADYGGQNQAVPYYNLSLPLKSGSMNDKYNVSLRSVRSERLSRSDIELLEGQDIGNEFELSAKVMVARGEARLIIRLIPFRKIAGGIEKLVSASLQYNYAGKSGSVAKQTRFAENSVLASGTWYKLKIYKSGIYRITYEQLSAMGIENPSQVRVFGNDAGMLSFANDGTAPDDLRENYIINTGSEILFYAKGPNVKYYSETDGRFRHRDHLYSDYVYYFFSSDYNSGFDNRLPTQNSLSEPADFQVDRFTDFAYVNPNEINLAKTGRAFFGDVFDIILTRNYRFEFPNIVLTEPVEVLISVAGASGSASSFSVACGQYSGSITMSALAELQHARAGYLAFETLPVLSDAVEVELTYNQLSASWRAWLDYMEVNAVRRLQWTGEAMHFTNPEAVGAGQAAEYIISNADADLQIWDITNPVLPRKQEFTLSNGEIRFIVAADEMKEFIVFKAADYINPGVSDAETVQNQNLHALSYDVDLLIVSHPLFYNYAEEIKNLREDEGLDVFLTTPEIIYNEFSCGTPDISAIRNFVKMLYERAPQADEAIRYLLLFGDASYDNKGDFEGNTNFILSYQSGSSVGQTSSYFSDDFFGLLDDGEGENVGTLEGLLDIGVGRIPASTATQAYDYMRKLNRYRNSETYGNWRNRLVFVADDQDSNAHIRDADTLTILIDRDYPWFDITKIYLDSYKQETGTGGDRYPEAQAAINNSVLKGALLVNYTGHGGERGWAHERVLTISDIESWTNFDRLALFVTATCEFTRFDDYEFFSAGERVFFNPQGGAIAMFTTARVAYIHSNAALTKAFYRYVFESDETGEQYRLGDVIRLTKNDRGGQQKDLIFFLLGDPSMKLGYARHNVITETINGEPIESFNDTLKALSRASFSGRVENLNGTLLDDFDGLVYPTVFDKVQEISTLNNDGEGVWTYNDRKNVLFKGQATVNQGRFEFEFIVPRDIFLNVDTGKVIYYAADDDVTAKGYNDSFLVGGISDNYPEDDEGPQINLFMNDENFVPGGTTDSDPVLFAKFWDASGINTASGAIGHDITAVVDNDPQQTYYLNSDYISDPDTYQSGSLKHYLFDLEEGEHVVKLSARDVYNNSGEKTLNFTVINTENLFIKQLLNYPNPFTTSTAFYFEHNKAFDQLDVLIQVFTPSGRLVRTIKETINSEGYRAGPFYWDGTDDFGNRIGRGAYIYRIKVRASDGSMQEEYQKLLILK